MAHSVIGGCLHFLKRAEIRLRCIRRIPEAGKVSDISGGLRSDSGMFAVVGMCVLSWLSRLLADVQDGRLITPELTGGCLDEDAQK